MKDTDLMPYGMYKGTAMANVPAQHLLWLYANGKCNMEVRDYIESNMDVLKKEVKK